MRALLLAAISTLGLVGCVGQLDSGTGPGPVGSGSDPTGSGSDTQPPPSGGSGSAADTARIDFNTNVYPIIGAKCGGCHTAGATINATAPGFVDPTTPAMDPSKAWTTITSMSQVVGSFTTTAQILTLPQSGHQGTSYTAQDSQAITDWLNLEATWRNASGTQPVDLVKQWSGCMTQTDFDTANMAQAWANQVNTNEGVCKQCHVNGTSYFMATPQSTYMFGTITTDRAYLMTFFAIDTSVTPNQIVINQTPFMTAAAGLTASGQHPRGWDPTNNNGMQALQTFYTSTMAHLTAGTCGQPTLLN